MLTCWNKKNNEAGNALWFILLAVALLGILTGVLTRSGSTVEQSGGVEHGRVKASALLRYAKGLEAALERMKLRGIGENAISFENASTTTDYTNSNCAADECKLFSLGGGGQEYRAPPAGANDGSEWVFTGHNNVGTTANPVGTTEDVRGNDLLVILRNLPESLCKQINRELGISAGASPPVDTGGIGLTPFTGTFYDGSGTPVILDGDPSPFELDGKASGCFKDNAAGSYYFYHVLLAR